MIKPARLRGRRNCCATFGVHVSHGGLRGWLGTARMVAMTEVHTAHTADLDAATLSAARALLYDVFDDMTDHDWEHALGGVHALVWEGAGVDRPRLGDPAPAAAQRPGLAHGLCGGRSGTRRPARTRARRGHDGRARGGSCRPRTNLAPWAPPTRPRPFMRPAAGGCGGDRARRLPRPVSDALRKRTAASMSFRWTVPLDLAAGLTCDWRDGDVW